MNAAQLIRFVAEHGPAARDAIKQEIETIDRRKVELTGLLSATDDLILTARAACPNPGVLLEESP